MARLRSGRNCVLAVVLAAVAVSLASALPASAVVPPTNCGNVKVKGDKFNVKADQIRCRKAKPFAVDYLKHKDHPRGYKCENYGAGTRIEFRCAKGIKVFFAIRR